MSTLEKHLEHAIVLKDGNQFIGIEYEENGTKHVATFLEFKMKILQWQRSANNDSI